MSPEPGASSPASHGPASPLWIKVQAALEKVRPALHSHGGDAEILEISREGVVRISLQGACQGCAMSMMTLKAGIEAVIREEVPEIISVEAISPE